MPSSPARRVDARVVSSIDAYVLPHVVEVPPAHEGFVARIFVRERDVVSKGQELVEVERGGERSVVRSPVPGVVSRCRARVGDAVEPSRPLASIVCSDDLLVVARFDPSAAPLLRDAKVGTVRIPRAIGQAIPAALVHVTGLHPWAVGDVRDAAPEVRVVARVQSAPPDALWPGIEAIVEVACGD